MAAGGLDQRFRFEKREEADDGYGNTVTGDWLPQFTVWAGRKYLRGGESVIADRLQARQPAILRIRNSSQARQITAEWRAVDDRTGTVFAIRENPTVTDDRAYLEMLVESGVAA